MALRTDDVIVVNEKDEWLGTMEKLKAHQEGTLHRAFSIFILNNKNELLLQQRAADKYHSGKLWSNTCCSHPAPAESTLAAAHRRLKEEMGFDCNVEQIFTFRYKADVGDHLIENEYDHIYLGYYNNEQININPEEVQAYKFMPLDEISNLLTKEPDSFTTWFHKVYPKFVEYVSVNA